VTALRKKECWGTGSYEAAGAHAALAQTYERHAEQLRRLLDEHLL
jgi:hypothetical protein